MTLTEVLDPLDLAPDLRINNIINCHLIQCGLTLNKRSANFQMLKIVLNHYKYRYSILNI